MNKKNQLSFEESLKELENIVDKLESGDIDLEKSLLRLLKSLINLLLFL